MTTREQIQNKMTTSAPKYKIGDTIYWYCDIEQVTHHAQVEFVNYAHVGGFYADINYEVEVMCCGERKTLFIDEDKAMPKDF